MIPNVCMGSILVAGGQVLHPRLNVNYIENLSKTDQHSTIRCIIRVLRQGFRWTIRKFAYKIFPRHPRPLIWLSIGIPIPNSWSQSTNCKRQMSLTISLFSTEQNIFGKRVLMTNSFKDISHKNLPCPSQKLERAGGCTMEQLLDKGIFFPKSKIKKIKWF